MTRRNSIIIVLVICAFAIASIPVIRMYINSQGRDIAKLLRENGFTEIKPPSTLVLPGSVVLIKEKDPLRLSTVCGPEGAFGITESEIKEHPSADVKTARTFEGSYSGKSELLGAAAEGGEVSTTELILSNVKIVEMSDEDVINKSPKRSDACQKAMLFRYKEDRQNFTLIDSALIADAEIRLTFKDSANSKEKTDKLAKSMDFTVKGTESGNSVLIGKGLVWGVRDDQQKIILGLGLPATGGVNRERQRALPSGKEIIEIDRSHQARLDDNKFKASVVTDVRPLKQPTDNSCWATVYTMMYTWKQHKQAGIEDALYVVGEKYVDMFKKDEALPFGEERAFAQAAGLVATPPASYPLEWFRKLLREHGPMLITAGDGLRSHAQLLTGIYSITDEENEETYKTSQVEYVDPYSGLYVYEDALSFEKQFEQEAAYVVSNKRMDEVDLRWQILYYP